MGVWLIGKIVLINVKPLIRIIAVVAMPCLVHTDVPLIGEIVLLNAKAALPVPTAAPPVRHRHPAVPDIKHKLSAQRNAATLVTVVKRLPVRTDIRQTLLPALPDIRLKLQAFPPEKPAAHVSAD